jgi:hypothetical protein
VGKTITVVASYTDGGGFAESISSAVSVPVVNINDAPTGTVNITGTATQGQTLTASNSLADIDGLGVLPITYQWKAGGINILGPLSTGSTYTLTQAEVGKTITVVASYTDGQGTAESKSSLATLAIANVNDLPTGSVTISGTATQGAALTATNNLADVDVLGPISYQWKAGGVAIAGATGSTYTLTQSEVGKAITVTASYIDGQGTAESKNSSGTGLVANINDLPTGSVTITGAATQGQTLTASNTLNDLDGLGVITYQWKADGVNIVGATGTSYVLKQAEVGKVISVVASYTDGQGTPESVPSLATAAVANVNDLPTGTVSITGTVAQNQTLTASNNLADADGLGAITYQWKADGIDIGGATNGTLALTQAEVGKTITVIASYTDLFGTAESKASAATALVANVNDLPTGSVTISGITTQGEVLTATNNLADVDGLGPISYQWKANNVAITGATASTYTLTQAEVNKTITVVASYTDLLGTAESKTSSTSAPVVNVNDLPTGSVTISGIATQGQLLTASNNLADLDGLGTIGYQWQAGGVNITGATSATYTLTQAEVGKPITVVASYTDLLGTPESQSSAATGSVVNVNDLPTGTVTITGIATQEQTLTAGNSLADLDGLGTINYQWQANGINIAGAANPSYVLTQAEVGKTITVVASYTDLLGTAESKASSATTPVVNVNDPVSGTVTITGTPTQGQTLAVSSALVDPDGLGPVISYQWKADGVNISGATSTSYTLKQAEVGKAITVVASYTDLLGSFESLPSAPTALVANVNDAPVLTAPVAPAPYIDTKFADTFPVIGGTLIATDVDAGTVFTYGVSGGAVSVDLLTDTKVGTYGTLTVTRASGAYTYTPNNAAIEALLVGATDVFTVKVTDEGLLSDSKTLTITINQKTGEVTESNGNDILTGASTGSVDHWAGLNGNDTYFVDNAADTVTELVNGGTDVVYSTAASYTLGANIEGLVLLTGAVNATGNDQGSIIIGNTAANLLTGGTGNDLIDGGVSDVYNPGVIDTLNGGNGNDTFRVQGFFGQGVYNGGAGSDWIDFSQPDAYTDGVRINQNAGINVHLDVGAAYTYYRVTDGFLYTDNTGFISVNAIENVRGTNQSDIIIGDSNDNILDGGASHSYNASLQDFVYGGDGNDTILVQGFFGHNLYYGANGNDWIDFSQSDAFTATRRAAEGAGVIVNLGSGNAYSYYLSASAFIWTDNQGISSVDSIENARGTTQNDILQGDVNANILEGGAGNDDLGGGEGADTYIGGLGADTLNLAETTPVTDTVRIAAGDSLATVGGYDVVNNFAVFDNVIGNTGIDQLDLVSTNIAANATVDGTNAGVVMSHSITSGLISFGGADIYNAATPLAITTANLANVLSYLQTNITGSNTVAFVDSSNNTYVYQDGGSPAADTLVELVGVSATGLNTTAFVDHAIWIV